MKVANSRRRFLPGIGLLAAAFLLIPQAATATTAHNRAVPPSSPRAATVTTRPKSAALSTIVCTFPTPSLCLDRAGGGTANGTHIIGWPPNFNDNSEDLQPEVLNSWCNNGFVTQTCPFTVGSGLNARYATACHGGPCQIVELISTTTNPTKCIGSDSTWSQAILNGCLPNGGAFVESNNGSGTFLVDVGVSNHFYAFGHPYDEPFWLVTDGTRGDQLQFQPQATNSWATFVPSGSRRDLPLHSLPLTDGTARLPG
jgi:hypothetical protein